MSAWLAGCGGPSAAPDGGTTLTDTGVMTGDAGCDGGSCGLEAPIELVPIAAGSFEMGDHHGFGGEDPRHPSDEVPLHVVALSSFQIARTETTCAQYVPFLEALSARGEIEVQAGTVVSIADGAPYSDTSTSVAPTCVAWDGAHFAVMPGREQHPVSGVRWIGAAAFCNWYGASLGLDPCYDLATGTTDWSRRCVRLPTEAEWEYAGRGGQQTPYWNYPWGDSNEDARVNWVDSNDPWERAAEPRTTPVAFFDGSLRQRSDYGWPADVESYQTLDGRSGFGLADMAGNVWEWVNDWYGRGYYATSPAVDPPGPAVGDPMPDGLPYRILRGGSYFNSTLYRGDHERVSNRDPAYFRGNYLGVDDPNGPWFHIGFRVAVQER